MNELFFSILDFHIFSSVSDRSLDAGSLKAFAS